MNKEIQMNVFFEEIRPILASSMGTDYAGHLIREHEHFVSDVKANVEETSAWRDEGYYNDDDIRLAIGRVILDYLEIPVI